MVFEQEEKNEGIMIACDKKLWICRFKNHSVKEMTQRHIIFELLKASTKKENLEAARKK